MTHQPLIFLCAAALLCPAVLAQKPLSESELLKQIESLTPASAAAGAKARDAGNGVATQLFDPDAPALKNGKGGKAEKPKEKKAKGPTEITAEEATFEQKANLAVFIGNVIVKDPEFNVACDKLTAHLKNEQKPAPVNGAPAAPVPKPATPAPDQPAEKKKSGGLEKAIAESTSDRRVVITQDKTEADNTVTKSVGTADKATYDAVTGDIVLTGTPEVQQGINRVIATSPNTVMILNRDGRMKAIGPHKTIIVDKVDAGL